MSFARVTLWNGLAVGIRMGTALVLNKILAIFVGPGGYALIGQFQNLMAVAITLGSGATAQGVTRYTAEYFDDEARQRRVWQTAGSVTLIGCVIAALLIIPFSGWLAETLLHDISLTPVFVALALGLGALAMNALLLSIITGRKATRLFVAANIAGSLIGLAFTGGLAIWFGLHGALLALALNQSIAFVVTAWLVRHEPWFRWRYLVGPIDMDILKALARYALMAATTALATPIAQVMVRQGLVSRFGLEQAGYVDAMMRISALYLLFFTSTMAVYYLPRIAEIRNNNGLRDEVWSMVYRVTPAIVALSALIYVLRVQIVELLFDARFLPMAALFGYQMVGDVLKIISWLFAYVMIGRGLTRAYISTEMAFAFSLVALTSLATRHFGIEGASIAYMINYALYLPVVYLIFRSVVGGKEGAVKA